MTSKVDSTARYLKTHEWARPDGDEVVLGISDHAQEAMGDLVYVELPRAGDAFKSGEKFAVVESVKAASEVYAPVGGTVVAVNDALDVDQGLINRDPYGTGWLIRVKPISLADFEALMDAAAYEKLLEEEEA